MCVCERERERERERNGERERKREHLVDGALLERHPFRDFFQFPPDFSERRARVGENFLDDGPMFGGGFQVCAPFLGIGQGLRHRGGGGGGGEVS